MADPAVLPNGQAVLIAIEDSPGAGTFTTVGCQRDFSWSEDQATIDVSCKDERNMRVSPGRYSGSLDFDLVYDPADARYLLLRASVRTGEKLLVQRSEDGTAVEEVDVVVTSMSHDAPDQDTATVSISADYDGQWVAA